MKNMWPKKYLLLKNYYNTYGNLDIPNDFRSFDGIVYNKNGYNMYNLIKILRKEKEDNKLTQEQIKCLEELQISWEKIPRIWDKYYNLAKTYYDTYNDLDIPYDFITSDGITYDENGYKLGQWIIIQRRQTKEGSIHKINENQIKLLNDIKMIWDKQLYSWHKYYNLAKKYYEKNGNIEIPIDFITSDGITYDEYGETLGRWIIVQRQIYNKTRSGRLSKEQINLLNSINMVWNAKEKEMLIKKITYNNKNTIKKEMLKKLYLFLDEYKKNTINTKNDIENINKGFTKKLSK